MFVKSNMLYYFYAWAWHSAGYGLSPNVLGVQIPSRPGVKIKKGRSLLRPLWYYVATGRARRRRALRSAISANRCSTISPPGPIDATIFFNSSRSHT